MQDDGRDTSRVELLSAMKTDAGTILLTTLWVLVILSTVALGLAFQARLELATSSFQEDAEKMDMLIQGALDTARARLDADRVLEIDACNEPWAIPIRYSSQNESQSDQRAAKGETIETECQILDENSKVPINAASAKVITAILEAEYGAEVNASELASYIIDWIDGDDTGYGESRQYAHLDPPYSCRNNSMKRIEELVCVQGVTPWLFFGEDKNCNGVLDPNEDDGDETAPFDNGDGTLQRGLRDLFTVHSDGDLNANTVDPSLLETVCSALFDAAKARDIVTKIVTARSGPDGVFGTADDRPFRSVDSIRQTIGASEYRTLSADGIQLVPYSQAFTVIVQARCTPSDVQKSARITIVRDRNQSQVLSWQWS